jgi:hypothetical protein
MYPQLYGSVRHGYWTARWTDGDTFLNSGEDRVVVVLIGVFATILGFYMLPEALRSLRSPAA